MPPNGGPRDTAAPKMLNKDKVDSLLNFRGGKIELVFDEYFKLQDLQSNFDISPLTIKTPRITIKKKSLIIELPDSLLESNTTYHLSFGDAIRDRRENNAYKNLQLVFSTGSFFDSMQLAGQVFDANTGTPDSLKILLYPENMPDSQLLKQRPLYVSSATNGQFMFNGLPAKRFKIAALKDKNANYLYDTKGEKIAFLNEQITIGTLDSSLILYSFLEPNMQDTSIGSLGKKTTGTTLSYTFQPNIKQETRYDFQDSLFIMIHDTLASVNTSKIRFYENEALDLSMNLEFDSTRQGLLLSPEWKMGSMYRLILQPGFLSRNDTAFSQADTINFTTMDTDDYGSITVKLDTALFQEGAIVQLYQNEKLIKKVPATLETIRFDLLKPQEYELRLLYDENDDSLWNAGNLSQRKQAEITLALPQKILLKPNWEEHIEWQLGTRKTRMGAK